MAALLEGWCYGLPGFVVLLAGGCICLVSCSNSPIRRQLVRRSASTSSVLACIVSKALSGGSAVHVAWLVLHPLRIGVAPACVPS